jgi:hypothetical protein
MADSTIIKSANHGTALEFFDQEPDYFSVRLHGPDFHGAGRVYAYEPTGLASFFRDLAAHWRGWTGKKEWASLEGELSLCATCDSTGHTSLTVRLRSGPYPFDWSLSVVLLIEAGQLEQIASHIEQFFRHDHAA